MPESLVLCSSICTSVPSRAFAQQIGLPLFGLESLWQPDGQPVQFRFARNRVQQRFRIAVLEDKFNDSVVIESAPAFLSR